MYYILHKLPPKHRPYKHARGICISPYVGPYSYGELNYCVRLHILITFIYIITPLLTSTHKPCWHGPPLVYSKIIEVVIFNRISTFLQSSSNQFWFKPKHGTELCVFAFKELLRFYNNKNMVLPCISPSWMHRRLLNGNLKVVEYRRIF